MRRRLVVLLSAGLITTGPLAAQEQRATIEGVVKDTSGAVVTGASVTATSSGGGTYSTTSDNLGVYRFPALPPGSYEVSASKAGFSPVKINVPLALGRVVKIDLSLTAGAVTEAVQVVAEAPQVDVTQSARFQNIRDEYVDKMPKGRDFTSLATQAPAANIEKKLGGLSIDGASGAENAYIIDGIETNDLQTGISAKDLVTDFVEEVQVKSSGYPAEFRGAVGGVVNVITKSGTNDFTGSVWAYYSGDALGYARSPGIGDTNRSPSYADGRPSLRRNPLDTKIAEYVEYDKDSVRQIEPGFAISGPISKDKVWFFASYNPQFRTIERDVTFLADQTKRTTSNDRQQHFANANISAQLQDNLRARIAYNQSRLVSDGLLASLDGTDSAATLYDIKATYPNWSVSGSLDYVPSNNISLSMRGGYFLQDTTEDGRPQGVRYSFPNSNVGLATVPVEFQRPAGFTSSASNFEIRKNEFTRLSLQTDASFFVNAGGQHHIKVGAQIDRLGNDVDEGETGNLVRVRFDRSLGGQRGTFGYYQVRSFGPGKPKLGFSTFGNVKANDLGVFIQDSWTISRRLTVNVGIRTEKEEVPAFLEENPGPAFEFSFSDKIAPRLGLAYDVKGDGKWKAFASWGIFYDITKLEMPRGSFGADHWLEYYYTLDTPNWTNLAASPDCPPACPGRLFRGPIDFRHPSFDSVDPDIKPYKLQEATAGVEHQLTDRIALGLSYVHKQVDAAIEDIGALDAQQNEIYTIGNPGLGVSKTFFPADSTQAIAFPKAVRDYDAVQLTFNRRMADNWALRASYVWSRLHGNYSGLSQADENGRISPNVGRNFDYPVMSFDERGQAVFGLLPTDRTHQFKTQFIYDFKFDLSVGVLGYLASGTPVTREAAFISPNNFPVQYLGRGSDGRTDMYSQLDLNLVKSFKFGDRSLQIMANVLNVLGQEASIAKYQTELEAGTGIDVSEVQFYQGVNTAALIDQQRLVRDSRFLKDSEFQAPREIRLGLRFIF